MVQVSAVMGAYQVDRSNASGSSFSKIPKYQKATLASSPNRSNTKSPSAQASPRQTTRRAVWSWLQLMT
jgi:hypothetical protein